MEMFFMNEETQELDYYPHWKDAQTFKSEGFKIVLSTEEQKAYESQLTAEGKREITTRQGETFVVDTTEVVCEKWGVKAGQRILLPSGEKALVLGVGIQPRYSQNGLQMWYLPEGATGAFFWKGWDNAQTFKSEGFQIPEPSVETPVSEVPSSLSVTYTSSEQLNKTNLKPGDWVSLEREVNYRVQYDHNHMQYGLYPKGDVNQSPLESTTSLDFLTIWVRREFKNLENALKSAEAKAEGILPFFPEEKASESEIPIEEKSPLPFDSSLPFILRAIHSKKIRISGIVSLADSLDSSEVWAEVIRNYGTELQDAIYLLSASKKAKTNPYILMLLCEFLANGEEEDLFILEHIIRLDEPGPLESNLWKAFAERLEYQDLESEKSEK